MKLRFGEIPMTHIVLDDEQAKVLSEADGPVEVWDRRGNVVGVATPYTVSDHGFTEAERLKPLEETGR